MLCSPPQAASTRMPYRRSGDHGLHLSALGLSVGSSAVARSTRTPLRTLLCHAMAQGISHFDITPDTTYRTESAEKTAQAIAPLLAHRSDIVLSARIGLDSSPGHMQGFASRKRLLGGLDDLLLRTGLDCIDILYAHRHERETPLEETTQALSSAVQQGKALYVGLSGYAPATIRAAAGQLLQLRTPVVSCQTTYSLLNRWAEDGLKGMLEDLGIGCDAGAPLAHGSLAGSPEALSSFPALSHIAAARNQSVAQLALAWTLRSPWVTSALVTTSRLDHLAENCASTGHLLFTPEETEALDACCPSPSALVPLLGEPAMGIPGSPGPGRGRHRRPTPDPVPANPPAD
ncbi:MULTISPECIES: aldo/keto reductase [Streptomyces]|nr:aldo/keto reductase [Streptomyces kasugaensis]